jgi:hypothetical protein
MNMDLKIDYLMGRSSALTSLLLFLLLWGFSSLQSQSFIDQNFELIWNTDMVYESPVSIQTTMVYNIQNGFFDHRHPEIPLFSTRISLSSYGELKLRLNNIKTERIEIRHPGSEEFIDADFKVFYQIVQSRDEIWADISVFPVRMAGTRNFEKLVSFKLIGDFIQQSPSVSNDLQFRNNRKSVLADGDVYKLELDRTGIYRINRSFLEELGINLNNLDPRRISIYSNPGGVLPEPNAADRPEDLIELAIYVEGEQDGNFDQNDFILFYAEGPDVWRYSENANGHFVFNKNIYDTKNYAFLKIGNDLGLRAEEAPLVSSSEYASGSYDFLQRHEIDEVNLLGNFSATLGGGKLWFGDFFNGPSTLTLTNRFSFTDILLNEPVKINVQAASRSGSSSRMAINIGGSTFEMIFGSVSINNQSARYASLNQFNGSASINSQNPTITLSYQPTAAGSQAWLDFMDIIGRRNLNFNGTQMNFRDHRSKDYTRASFTITNPSANSWVWDVSNPTETKRMGLQSGSFNYLTEGTVKEFVVFNPSSGYRPVAIGKIENQNLRGLDDIDMLVLYYQDFEPAAKRFAEHRSTFSDLKVEIANIQKVYNEFSGGRVDPTAIRDFARLLYQRNRRFNYLLLIGDATYDYRGLISSLPKHNFIPCYQTFESLAPIETFPTDDYFALLDETEGNDLRGGLDIAVGRLTVTSAMEADDVVNKIINYDIGNNRFGAWRLNKTLVADDGDQNRHLNQSDNLARRMQQLQPLYNQDKIYIDAYVQESTPGGQRYPDAEAAINANIFKGQLIMNYLGHGGPRGWAQQRILRIPDIQSWSNFDKLTLMITATCSFTSYDDASLISAGEYVLSNPRGGAVALYTTTRDVFISDNERLVNATFDQLFVRDENTVRPMGEVLRMAKNANQADTLRSNARKYTMLGDPSQRLAIPQQEIKITKINDIQINEFSDTLRALDFVSVDGEVIDFSGNPDMGFNGTLEVTIYDKANNITTRANNPSSNVTSFQVFRNIIFKGKATVERGMFKFSFIIPKDINYQFGEGKISLYAFSNMNTDAAGYNDKIIIGGSSNKAIVDETGPEINIFMNDESFVFGGITNTNPVLLIKLKDDSGINITGNSIGHDLTAELNGPIQETFILNEFYQANIDDFTSGVVRFPIRRLEPGKYNVRVKAWDVANNSNESYSEFFVVDAANQNLQNVLNYPNPFTTHTSFNFEHDLPGGDLEILVHIYTISGKLVRTIQDVRFAGGFRVADLHWDGRDDFGDSLARGVYLYKIKAKSPSLNEERESNFMKLVKL